MRIDEGIRWYSVCISYYSTPKKKAHNFYAQIYYLLSQLNIYEQSFGGDI